MKTKIEIAGFEIEIVEKDGVVTLVAMKDGDAIEEIVLGEEGEEVEMPESTEREMGVKGFDEFAQEEDEDEDEMEEDEDDMEEDEMEEEMDEVEMSDEEEEEDFEEEDEDEMEMKEDEMEEDGKLESFQAFIKKYKN